MALLSFVGLTTSVVGANAIVAPVGQGFTVAPSDLAFILKQIKIAEHHAATLSPAHPCDTLVGPGPDQIPDALTSYGLRTVDGSCNNLIPGREKFGAADQPFPRFTTPVFRAAETTPPGFGPPAPTSYAQKSGSVFDSQPREISNLIVDQTSTNPAAVAAAKFPVRTQRAPGLDACTTDPVGTTPGIPAGCVPSHQTLFIPNVTTDVGLSPPYNSLFTFFGQFFDHGVDQTVKSGGTVFVPLHDDDPLIAGPDHILGNADDLPVNQRFMVLTRAQNQPGPDGVLGTADDIQNANNTDSPWVDQSQTYTSHASHQVFVREYVNNPAGKPVSTGKLLGGLGAGLTYLNSPDGTTGMATWASVKNQAHDLLGLKLVDTDVTNIPMLATDPYGKFIPGPARGLPQYVTATGLVEGQLDDPLTTTVDETVPVPADVLHFDTPFLTDIAHNADPSPQDTDHNPATPPVAPVPDADNTPSADFANQPAGTYDDEMLNAHFIAGDGRVNENIALTTIHQVFHSEHDRLIDDIKNTLNGDTSATGVAALAEWKLTAGTPDGWNGERLFQAARFVTEMEYQHLVFEEFARKVQPAIQPFHVYHSDINPAIHAEFAHAVYRFGHSMLDDTVARTNENGSDNSIPLLKAFLNPPEYFNSGSAIPLTPAQAAGSVVMGSSDQVGNELDEFVTETLRNNLLGLPLDLPTLNMTRARDAGVPPLNNVRRQIHAATNDGQLAPYTSWSDFGQHLKHPESLINFVAAYGKHPSITSQTTLAGKRDAARAIVNPAPTDVPPADAADFMFGTGAYANTADGVTVTGLDDVDLWVGGLAEITNLFGGLLGSTFNYVFENQLTDLQNGDRLYYLARTPGMNLRSQLESNSFAELIQRNTDGTNTLKADAFATADCKFQLSNLNGTPAGFTAFGSTVANDPTTACDETALLLRKPDGTIQYRQVNSVNPVGINGQSVYNGTPGVDRIFGGNDNDTFWGGAGNDVIDGNGGDDVMLGGDGNDIITDLAGNDTLKGGPGNDALDGGIGNDAIMGGDGQDFTSGGGNDNTTFGGPGNDFIRAGDGADVVFGDGGDDWIEGGSGQDLLQGDHGAPFFDDPAQTKPGNDIMIGQVGENDYDAEGGDDIMSANAAIDRFAGAAGFDWAIHQYNTVPADDDMNINQQLNGVPLQVVVNRDRWQETEADSGSGFNDVIRGTNTVPSAVGGAGFSGCDVLDQAGLDRISGLAALLPPLTGDPAPVIAASAMKACPTNGPIWGDGNILLGGPGSDTIEGRGADDIIDGDRYLQVRISVRTNPADPATETGTTDLMENKATSGDFGPGTAGMTLQQAVFAGLVDPGNLVSVREILSPPAGTDTASVDTAVFSGPLSNYTIESVPATGTTLASVKVTQTGANVAAQKVSDGIDTLRNIEMLQFSDQTVSVASAVAPVPAAPAIGAATAAAGSATVSFTAPANVSPAITSFEIVATPATGAAITVTGIPATATSGTVTGLTNGTTFTLQVRAVNANGPGPLSAASNPVTPAVVLPGAPAIGAATAAAGSATVSFTAPANVSPAITSFEIVATPATGTPITATGIPATATSGTVTGLTNGTTFTLQVRAVNANGPGPLSAASNPVTPAVVLPGAPAIGAATAAAGSATVSFTAPANVSPAITSFEIVATPATGTPITATGIPATATSGTVTGLTNGTTFTLQVRAVNANGPGPLSAASNPVTPAVVLPGAPAIGAATATTGSATATTGSATVNFTAPANVSPAIASFEIVATPATGAAITVTGIPATATSGTVTGLTNGTTFTLQVRAVNANGPGPLSAASNPVTPAVVLPGAPAIGAATATTGSATATTGSATVNFTAPANVSPAIASFEIVATPATGAATTVTGIPATATSGTVTGLTIGTTFTLQVRAVNANGPGPLSAASNPVTPTRDTVAPTVKLPTTPAAGAFSVSQTANLTATLSEAVRGVTGTNFQLRL
ncbi:peroxidase family protein, partial [Pseudarthrobacter albicanus]|uniref:peroxidase family protein n=1 Tax=Pseudarthrobacter albicanus TaxID=2823873 RepID=UPI001BA61855